MPARPPTAGLDSVEHGAGEVRMSELLQNYGFFMLVAILMVVCHLGHGRHGGHGRDGDDKGQSGGGQQH